MPILMNNNQLKRLNLNKTDALTFYPPKVPVQDCLSSDSAKFA